MQSESFIQAEQLSNKLANTYSGDVVVTDREEPQLVLVSVEALSDVLVKIQFEYNDFKVDLRAILSEEERDIHMIIQEKVTDDYILNGVSGFLCQKPNIHGGFIGQLESFYFHILLNHFSGKYQEFYFFGKALDQKAIAV